MSEKIYVSDMNYNPGEKSLPAGTVFTTSQWVAAGGKEDDLEMHVAKGYIKEAKQEAPEDVATKEEAKEEKKAPDGIWNFDIGQLEGMSIEVLNTIYKQRAAEFDMEVTPYEDKDALILKMCSQKG